MYGSRDLRLVSALFAAAIGLSCSGDSTRPQAKRIPTAVILTGNGQTGTVGASLPTPIGVTILDQNGYSLGGVAVTFAVTAGGGSLGSASVFSTADGTATTTWTLGPTAGINNNSVTVAITGYIGQLAAFTAGATSSAATQLQVAAQPSGTAQSGIALAIQPSVRLEDAFGNPAPHSGPSLLARLRLAPARLAGRSPLRQRMAWRLSRTSLLQVRRDPLHSDSRQAL